MFYWVLNAERFNNTALDRNNVSPRINTHKSGMHVLLVLNAERFNNTALDRNNVFAKNQKHTHTGS